MYFPSDKSSIYECALSKEEVIALLTTNMELEVGANNLFEKNILFLNPLYGNMAQIECSVAFQNTKSVISVKFQIHYIFILSTILFSIFGIAGIVFAITKNDMTQLAGLIPLCILVPLEIIIFSFDKNNKIEKLKRVLHIK